MTIRAYRNVILCPWIANPGEGWVSCQRRVAAKANGSESLTRSRDEQRRELGGSKPPLCLWSAWASCTHAHIALGAPPWTTPASLAPTPC
jgi:hypothetical protein